MQTNGQKSSDAGGDDDLRHLTGAYAAAGPPPWQGKFAQDGTPLAYGGTTVICHIDTASADFAALTGLQSALRPAAPEGAFAWLATDSFHMTVFDCTNDGRRGTAAWPQDLPAGAAIRDCADALLPRLAGLCLSDGFRVIATGLRFGCSLRLAAADAAAETLLRQTRDRLAAALRLRDAGHNAYGFHITLGYRLRDLTLPEARQLLAAQAPAFAEFSSACPTIILGRAEFCMFDTLHRFDRLAFL